MNIQHHALKSWPKFFKPIFEGVRFHELRRNDRNFHVHDILLLLEFEPESENYTGRSCQAVITSITSRDEPCAVSKEGLNDQFCILSIKLVNKDEQSATFENMMHFDPNV